MPHQHMAPSGGSVKYLYEHIGSINMNSLVERGLVFANWLFVALFSIYIYSMLFHPWFNGGWKYAHAVWLEWQSLNVGILAFSASVIAFNISRYQATQQRRRELVAARAFLPDSLSELTQYLNRLLKYSPLQGGCRCRSLILGIFISHIEIPISQIPFSSRFELLYALLGLMCRPLGAPVPRYAGA